MGDPAVSAAFYAARPTLIVDGQRNPDLSGGVLGLLVEETTAGLYHCEVTIGNWGTTSGGVGYLYFDRSTLDFGMPFEIHMGSGEAEATIFDGRIMGLEAKYMHKRPPDITVLAEDRLQDLRMTRRTRSFEYVSDDEVMSRIAAEHGLRPELDIDGPTVHRVLAQVNQSDLAFLRERGRAIDAEVSVDGRTLRVEARGRRNLGEVTLTYGQRLQEASLSADLATQRTSFAVSGWNPDTKERIQHAAGDSAIRAELNGDTSGASILSAAVADCQEQLVHAAPITEEEARIVAEANFRRTCRQFVTGYGLAEGDGRIRVGSYLKLTGLGPLFNGRYYVEHVRHTFDAVRGYQTWFRVERPGLGRA